jgi:anti-sigma factor RsiW
MTAPHDIARALISKERIEGLTPAEAAVLATHLEECAECAAIAAETAAAIRDFRAVSLALPPSLSERTRARIYRHAAGRASNAESRWALWLAFGLSWITGVATAPLVWRGFEWLGSHAAVPELVLKTGFVLWWVLPALLAGGILFSQKSEIIGRR